MSDYFDLTETTLRALRNAGVVSLETITICSKCGFAFIDGIEGGVKNRLCDECNAEAV